ncbi:MAG TPA: DNA (cytosine-5-)-methyltransferase [Rickettsia endosymbiont of Omalisus fontisbellaquei]|nr:DNA (cytosine-5-)-methyltransferase [Rickettsia endosymbiont of Omalisus fontisbellaquei]
MKRTYKTIDLFAGIGGTRLAFEALNRTKNVFSSEIDKEACKTYELNFNENPYCDITKLNNSALKKIKDFDILLAGFPCQPFSIAGKGRGFEDDRGKLFYYIAKILKLKKPKAFLLENVKGLINHDNGNSLYTIIKLLTGQLNYQLLCIILNSKYYGVPQNRERIYIIGFQDKKDFNLPNLLQKNSKIADILEEQPVERKYYLSEKSLNSLKAHKERHLNKGNRFGYKIIERDGIASTLVSCDVGKTRNLIVDKRNKIEHLEVNSDYIRMLTPREWARLQGYPDSFKLPPANTHAYKQLGNSVTLPVISMLAESIIKTLDQKRKFELRLFRIS